MLTCPVRAVSASREPMTEHLHVACVASEMVPYAKTGGLADIAAALPKALAHLGHRVTVFLPRYRSVGDVPCELAGSVHVPLGTAHPSATYHVATPRDNVRVVFVGHPPFYDRAEPYGEGNREYPDNRLRFAFLARAALEFFRSRGERPDVFHAHDWQAGLVPVFLKAFHWDDPTLGRMPTVFTIHNLAYQGNFPADTLGVLGLPEHLDSPEGLEFHGQVSYLKGGVLFSEIVTTVSPQYAREIQQPELGHGFDGILRSRGSDLHGILNGVDYEEWDPRHDPHLASTYSRRDLRGKAVCKAALLREYGLPAEPDLPLVGVISRLVHQKGFDVVVEAWWDLLQRPLRMVVLGTGEPEVVAGFRSLAEKAPDRFAARFGYDTALAHRIEAGADLFLMPSRYEPCGLTQMYSLRYGTVPVVRATGGLVDTVEPWNPVTRRGTGFRFEHADGTGLMWALDQALAARADVPGWRRLVRNGMSRDFSWERSARAYVDLYRQARQRA